MLPQQHFDHARLRTVEAGIPLIRSCNTGITCAFDSLGRVVSVLGDNPAKMGVGGGFIVRKLPTYHYSTLYTQFAILFIGISLISLLFFYHTKA